MLAKKSAKELRNLAFKKVYWYYGFSIRLVGSILSKGEGVKVDFSEFVCKYNFDKAKRISRVEVFIQKDESTSTLER